MKTKSFLKSTAAAPQRKREDKVFGMPRKYVVKPLGEGKVLQAYPLVQSAVPHLTLEQWLDYVRSINDRTATEPGCAGVMSAETGDGYIYGLYCHAVEPDIHHGRVLKVRNFVAADLYSSAGIVDRLMDSIVSVARDSGCTAVHVDLPDSPSSPSRPVDGVVNLFKDAGFRIESVALCRPIDRA